MDKLFHLIGCFCVLGNIGVSFRIKDSLNDSSSNSCCCQNCGNVNPSSFSLKLVLSLSLWYCLEFLAYNCPIYYNIVPQRLVISSNPLMYVEVNTQSFLPTFSGLNCTCRKGYLNV